jgi:uroporphyrinogen decarboxylase
MIAGRGTPDQAPAHKLRQEDPETFGALMDLLTDATIEYLDQQVQAGAEVVKIFDSWAGSLKGEAFTRFALEPARRITAELKRRHPGLPVIVFPREAGENYVGFAKAVGADGLAIDTKVDPEWAAEHLQPDGCVQGNLDPKHMITGGDGLVQEPAGSSMR